MDDRKKRGLPPSNGKSTVTMRDVAQAAGLGIATVSRVLNNSPLVFQETADHVRNVMAELGYRGSLRRRGTPRTRTRPLRFDAISILLTGTHNLRWITNCAPIYAYTVYGAEAALKKRGLSCVIRHVTSDSDVASLLQMPVDGFLLFGDPRWENWPDDLKKPPAVKMLGLPDPKWYDCATYNSDTAGRLAADYLVDRGVNLAAILGSGGEGVFARRIQAFSQACFTRKCGVMDLTNMESVRDLPDMNMAAQDVVNAAVEKLLRASPRPQGIFVTSDVVTPAVYLALEKGGVAPGKDIAIVSCNNEKSYLHPLHPQPAVIDLQAEMIGQQAVERLLWRIEHPDATLVSLITEPKLLSPSQE